MRAWNLKPAALIGLGALLLLSLAPGDPSDDLAGPTNSGGTVGKDDFNNLEIVDSSLEPKLEIVRVGSQLGANNLLGVFAGLKNKTGRRLDLELETIYKNKAGSELNKRSWIRLSVAPHKETDYRSSAISEEAVDFLIRVRRAPSSAASAH
jgi:hypothetical protein